MEAEDVEDRSMTKLAQFPMNIGERISCLGKAAHRSATAAHNAIKHMGKERRERGSKIEAYHCPFCGAWHIGSRTRRVDLSGQRANIP